MEYDEKGREISRKNTSGTSVDYTYDDINNTHTVKTTYKGGSWIKTVYDSITSREIGYSDSNYTLRECIHKGVKYNLLYDVNKKQYRAGCQVFDYDGCVAFYKLKHVKKYYADAEVFMEIIKKHHKKHNHVSFITRIKYLLTGK